MRQLLPVFLFFISAYCLAQQIPEETERIRLLQLETTLNGKINEIKGLTEEVELELSQTDLSTLFKAVAEVSELNLTIAPELAGISIVNTFNEVRVIDLMLYLAQEYNLDYRIVGNIISIKKIIHPTPEQVSRRSDIEYDASRNFLSLDLNNAQLSEVFRAITNKSGSNLLFDRSLENKRISIFIKDVPLENALNQLAIGNSLKLERSAEGYFLFSPAITDGQNTNSFANRSGSRSYEVLDTVNQQLKVNFRNTRADEIIYSIADDLKLGTFAAYPLDGLGPITLKAESISYSRLLDYIFSSQENNSTTGSNTTSNNQPAINNNRGNQVANNSQRLTYKREGNLYLFGSSSQFALQNTELIPLRYRSIDLVNDNEIIYNSNFGNENTFASPNTLFGNANANLTTQPNNNFSRGNPNRNLSQPQNTLADVILDMIPDGVVNELEIEMDRELNSFIVSGSQENINNFKSLITAIDKPVPVILIETMIIEINRTSTIETGVEWGLGDAPVQDQGLIFPNTDLTLGANTVNRVLGGLEGLTSLNLGRVVPNFFANLKAMETNGDININSTPKLSVLNGHEAQLSIGQTTYYVITQTNIIGSQNPQTNTIQNFQPIEAELGVFIKPTVSLEGEITMGIVVNQSTFSSTRIAPNAPPDINTRKFTSTIRVRDKDIVVLGGLEDVIRSNTGTGVPFLARIPIIKFLFSKRVREGTKRKLAILIRPVVLR